MGINRRQFSLLLAGSLIAPKLLAKQGSPLIASAAKNSSGQYELTIVDSGGNEYWRHPLTARAHHVEQHPTEPLLAVVGRRPETFIDIVDYQHKSLHTRILSQNGRHFYGHAIFSPDGRYLISTENAVEEGTGLIVIRDKQQNYSVVAEHPSGGIGPHELKSMPDGETLVVANGGIQTHPAQGRKKLNLDTMKPSLAYINARSGEIVEQVYMPEELHQLSIRHIDINGTGRVAIALQYQGEPYENPPLVAFHSQGKALELVRAPEPVNSAMKQYCGSVRFDSSGEVVAISSPRGNLITFWRQDKGAYLSKVTSRDGCGVAKTDRPGEFLISSGRGHCYRFNLHTQKKQKVPLQLSSSVAWDNHLNSFY
ncbi:DUF1513 domain-containing protein [Neptuniibacter caesariensis]|uniref:DUF1513 domain-containing protein n=1 Tax=Neptuniibacter caesariensis TaxID=207954 RepID=A0A7U8GTY3_NEPCE|nr:DUF1513 domain-containing protein [Neptuniibacter caesariensis]EAR62605.1 hypothetical protein MED92_05788 [Oceanospirillum sp. MED92] [Neptuniibacter caesariensis]